MATEVYEWVLSGILGGQFVQTVQHVSADIVTPVNPFQTALAIAQDMVGGTNYIPALMDCLPEDYEATSLRVRKVDGSGGPTAIVLASTFTVSVGQRTGTISSASVCPLIIWIGTTTPDKTGRLFLPGVSEDDIDDMQLSSGLISAINTWAGNYATVQTLGADEYRGCILRRATSVGDIIIAGQISPLIGTQRRRLRPV